MNETIRNWWSLVEAWAAGTAVTWTEVGVAAGIIVAAALFATLFSRLLSRLLLRFSRFSAGDLDDRIIAALRGPVTALIILGGAYIALTFALTLAPAVQSVVNRVASVIAIIIGAFVLTGVSGAVLTWLEELLESSDPDNAGNWALPLARRGVMIVVVAMSAMVSLDILGINISPLIAGLGIGGLAVALALQPTLTNLFAGTYVITEGVVSAGDYIEMENGVTGYVVDVNWRSTRLRTWTNNLVVIPNSRFAETIITNYSKPDEHVNVYVTCGVAYESDLERVETVSIEVMESVEQGHPGVVRDYGVYFGYDTFGESNIDFWLFMQATDRLASFEVRSELIKQLHYRLATEGITINYPVRTLHFPNGASPSDLPAALEWRAGPERAVSGRRSPRNLSADRPGATGEGPEG